MIRGLAIVMYGAFLGASCGKVPIYDVNAEFTLADGAWFAEEETLFVFYEVTAEQGLNEQSVVEVRYATDDERVDWTPVPDFEAVHTHVPVDCGPNAMCGSTSIHVPLQPREVEVRLRYHQDGELDLDTTTVFNVVGPGDPDSHRSLLVYGVFDATNQWVQWRGRHQFPTLRNQQAEALGLRRQFTIRAQRFGSASLTTPSNPYGYGIACDGDFVAADLDEVETTNRAVFNPAPLPVEASSESVVCAASTVTDATGDFTTNAVAQKNPEVRDAFPVLRSPVTELTRLPFFFAPCDRTISADHEEMQRQRLQMESVPTTCIDDWQQPGFVDALVVMFRDAVEAERGAGNDMVLVLGVHHDDDGVSEAIEQALLNVVPDERHRSSPRVAGAFVLDSTIRGLDQDDLAPSTLWCPSTISAGAGGIPDASTRTCAVVPDNIGLELGPFTFGSLPILPPRDQYLDFIDTYSKAQAGEVQSLSFRAPEFATTSDHIDVGDFGVATFLNNEVITAESDDAFSYCASDDPQFVVFRSEFMDSKAFRALLEKKCDGVEDDGFCTIAEAGLLPIEFLGDWHSFTGEDTYDVGLFWDFPFLLHVEYEAVGAVSASAFGFSVPFGLASSAETYVGTEMWTTDTFPIEELTQCERFCDHPTFDSAGVYNVTDGFRSTYAQACYLPAYPELIDLGFPLDP